MKLPGIRVFGLKTLGTPQDRIRVIIVLVLQILEHLDTSKSHNSDSPVETQKIRWKIA